jgi:hypothetical protein
MISRVLTLNAGSRQGTELFFPDGFWSEARKKI